MNIREAKQEIIHTIRAYTAKNPQGDYAIPALRQRPLLLIGPPGIGKTAVMEQAARECGVGFVAYTMTHHTRQSAIGLPFIERRTFGGREYAITEYTMSEIIASVYRCMEESGCREGLLFLDEINCVSETLAPAMLQFLQNKTFGSHRLPDGWILASAGNPQEYNKSVREFDIATLDRLKYIEVEADYDAWRPYALAAGIHGAILSYLDTHPDRFYILKQSFANRSFVTARGWEDLSCMLLQYEALSIPVTPALIGEYLHLEELSSDFSGYFHLFAARKQALPVTELLAGSDEAFHTCHQFLCDGTFDEKLHLVHLILSCIGSRLADWNSASASLARIRELLDKLNRFGRQQHFDSPAAALSAFCEKEQAVLEIRREHGLSSDAELRAMHQSLDDLRTLTYDTLAARTSGGSTAPLGEAFLQQSQEKLSARSRELLAMTDRAITLLSDPGQAEFTVFLASLRDHPYASEFFRKHPCNAFEMYRGRLEFQTRENALRKKLLELS